MKDLKVLFNQEQLEKRITEMGKEIDKDYKGKEIVVICVLKGAIFFTVDLLKHVKTDTTLEFMMISSYSGTESTGNVNLNVGLDVDIKGKDVLIVEDIIDTGHSLKFLQDYLTRKEPKTLKTAVLLDKKERRKTNVNIDYTGFVIPNKFVVGYGFDIDEKYRNIPYIGYIED